jgi:hypothetical protein
MRSTKNCYTRTEDQVFAAGQKQTWDDIICIEGYFN